MVIETSFSKIESDNSLEIKNDFASFSPRSILNNNGVSAIFGLTIQFLQMGKESLALNFFYHQGFTKLRQIDLTYTLINDQQTYHTTLISKCTSFGASISYPTRFWDVDKRRARKAAGS